MLEKYRNVQEIVYNNLNDEIKNNRISHAYLIDENNYSEAFDFVMSFVKDVVGIGLSETEKEKIYRLIDQNCYSEVKIIVPDGNLIKKQQIIDLQKEFSMTAIDGKKRIYIVRSADKMRPETANSMLKFLEEPDNDVLAILMTNNISAILETIVSRCQNIKLNNEASVTDEKILITSVITFLEYLEENGIKAILKEQELFFEYVDKKDRIKIEKYFDIMIDIYYDILKVNAGNKNIIFKDYVNIVEKIAENNSYETILNKIKYLMQAKERIKYNVNINILLDDVIINIGGCNEDSWSKTWRK